MTNLIDLRTTLLPLLVVVGCATVPESEPPPPDGPEYPRYELGERAPIGDPTAPMVPEVEIAGAPAAPIQVIPSGEPVVGTPILHYVVFEKGSTLDREAKMMLDSVADHLEVDDNTIARLISCADRDHRRRARWRLDAVHDYFIQVGVEERRVIVDDGQPLMNIATDNCVEVRIVEAPTT